MEYAVSVAESVDAVEDHSVDLVNVAQAGVVLVFVPIYLLL